MPPSVCLSTPTLSHDAVLRPRRACGLRGKELLYCVFIKGVLDGVHFSAADNCSAAKFDERDSREWGG